jgi:hypothetical protein
VLGSFRRLVVTEKLREVGHPEAMASVMMPRFSCESDFLTADSYCRAICRARANYEGLMPFFQVENVPKRKTGHSGSIHRILASSRL